MTVKEMIEALKKIPEDAVVMLLDSHWDSAEASELRYNPHSNILEIV